MQKHFVPCGEGWQVSCRKNVIFGRTKKKQCCASLNLRSTTVTCCARVKTCFAQLWTRANRFTLAPRFLDEGQGGFQGRFHNQGRGFNSNGRGFQGRGFQQPGSGYGRGRGNFNPNDQYFQQSIGTSSDSSTIATNPNQSGQQQSDWDNYQNQNTYQQQPDQYYSDQRWY